SLTLSAELTFMFSSVAPGEQARTSSPNCWLLSMLGDVNTTSYPARHIARAIDRPIPRLAPVTKATRLTFRSPPDGRVLKYNHIRSHDSLLEVHAGAAGFDRVERAAPAGCDRHSGGAFPAAAPRAFEAALAGDRGDDEPDDGDRWTSGCVLVSRRVSCR